MGRYQSNHTDGDDDGRLAGTDCGNDEKQKQSRTTLQEQRVIKECITVNLMLPDLAIPRSYSFAPYSTFAIMLIFLTFRKLCGTDPSH